LEARDRANELVFSEGQREKVSGKSDRGYKPAEGSTEIMTR